jgi:predicted acylesterase/phospholipase RssA
MEPTDREAPGLPSERAADVRGKRALVLSGGGITGFLYEVGVLAGLEEAHASGAPFGGQFGLIVGTSAGAVAAALIANGVRPAEIFRALRDDLDSPFNFRPEDVYGAVGGAPRLVGQFTVALLGAIGRVIRQRGRPTLAAILADFQAHHPPGFYSTEPLERTLCGRFERLGYAHYFQELTTALYVTAVDIDTGERLVFGDPTLRDVHICRAVAASCAIPIFFRPIRIGDRDVVDGAIGDATPIDIAVERGATHIIYINPLVPIRNDRTELCLPLDGGFCGRLTEMGVGWIGSQALRLVLAAKLRDALRAVGARQPDLVVHVIQPAQDELPMFMHNVMAFSARREILDYGYACGRRAAGSITGPTQAGHGGPAATVVGR